MTLHAIPAPEDAAETMRKALVDAHDGIEDPTPQGSGLFVVRIDECGVPEIMASTELHESEIIAACFTLAQSSASILITEEEDYE